MYNRYIIHKRMTYLQECTDQSLMNVAFLLSENQSIKALPRGECSEPEMFNNQCDNQRKHLDEETPCVGATENVCHSVVVCHVEFLKN